ncbi:hypothetical protein Esti_000500 [Eimeria stiedai]
MLAVPAMRERLLERSAFKPVMLLLLLCWCLLCCAGSSSFAHERTGILPGPPRFQTRRANDAAPDFYSQRNSLEATEYAKFAGAKEPKKEGTRFAPVLVLNDLLAARNSSADGLLQLHYPVYLSHALLLSYAETKAFDLRRLPLHRFASRLRPDQIADLPLSSVGSPRPFHMFVLFTFVKGFTDAVAEGLSSQCKDCPDALAAFRKAATAFKRSGGLRMSDDLISHLVSPLLSKIENGAVQAFFRVFLHAPDASAAHQDKLPVFFAVINVGTRDGAAISAIHPAMQLPAVMHLPPTQTLCLMPSNSFQDAIEATSVPEDETIAATSSLLETTYRINAADFFARSLGDEVDEQTKLQELISKQKAEGIHGKVHFLSLPQSHLLLLQRRKNEASLEERLLQWTNNRTNRDVSYFSLDASPQTDTGRSKLLGFVPLLAAALGWLAWKMVVWLREKRWVIVVGGVAAYTLCSSGLVFSIIHSVPFAGFDVVTGRYVFIAATSRVQYLAEGLVLSCCSTITSLAALGLVRSSHIYEAPSRKALTSEREGECSAQSLPDDAGWKEAERGIKWRHYFSVSSYTLLAVLMVFCCGFVMHCYRSKAAWYAPTFWPDPNLPTGPLKADWGNMF